MQNNSKCFVVVELQIKKEWGRRLRQFPPSDEFNRQPPVDLKSG